MKKLHILMYLACILLFAACDNEDYLLYDTTQKNMIFMEFKNQRNEMVDTLDYEYGFDIATDHIVRIPVRVMGMPADKDRTFEVAPVSEASDMVEGTHYTIEPTVIKANSVEGEIVVHLLRGNDEAIQERQFTLNLQLKENENFRPEGRYSFRLRYSDIHPGRPDWWPATYTMPPYTYEIAQKFFEYFYQVEAVQPSVFRTMIANYGDYFVNAVSLRGPFAMYGSFLSKYVLIPLREYYRENDPDIYAVFPEPNLY